MESQTILSHYLLVALLHGMAFAIGSALAFTPYVVWLKAVERKRALRMMLTMIAWERAVGQGDPALLVELCAEDKAGKLTERRMREHLSQLA